MAIKKGMILDIEMSTIDRETNTMIEIEAIDMRNMVVTEEIEVIEEKDMIEDREAIEIMDVKDIKEIANITANHSRKSSQEMRSVNSNSKNRNSNTDFITMTL